MPLTKTIASSLSDDIISLMSTGKTYSPKSDEILSLEEDARKLSKVKIAEGYTDLAAAAMLYCDYHSMRSLFKIARNQGLHTGNRFNYAIILGHAGFFSEAADSLNEYWTKLGDLVFEARVALSLLQLHKFMELMNLYKKTNPDALPEEVTPGFYFGEFMKENNISDKDCADLLDVAGEVMREKSTYYIGTLGLRELVKHDQNETSYLVCRIDIPLDVETASEMTLELANRVINNPITAKLLVRFHGMSV